ncbi:unnamed protein product, partial [Ectocarpus sp. 13 AM-2016]
MEQRGHLPQQQREQHRQTCRGTCAAGMRLLASAVFAAMALSHVAGSETLPSNPPALPRGASCGLNAFVPPVCNKLGATGARGDRVLAFHASSSLRGGFSWGSPEQQQQQQRQKQRQPSARRGASGMFGASWGGGSSDNNNSNSNGDNNGDKRPRVETRGPPDLNTRLPPTAPGSDDGNGGGGGGFFSAIGGGGGGGGSSRERVKTVGPPDAGKRRTPVRARLRGGRRGLFSGGSVAPTAPPLEQQQEQAGGRFGGGRPQLGWGQRAGVGRDDGEGEGPVRGWGEGGGSVLSDRKRGLMAVHFLVLSCFGLFSLNTLFGVDRLFGLSLNHQRPRWWQSITSLLLHGDQHHLMGNMFNLIIFGKMAEEDMGSIGMLMSFVACGVASSFVSLMIMPQTARSCGASGAIFGLYSVCVLGKMFNLGRRSSSDGRLRKLIEAAVFGWFVVDSVISEMRMVVAGGVKGIDHAAHFGGVFAGAVLILMFRRSFREQSIREERLRG